MANNLDFANTNILWGSFLVESLFRLGVRHAVIAPGSRSAPLAYAFALHPEIRAIPILDERSASFFALGIAKRRRRPVVLVCTSGTAGANFFPAIIEARASGIPLLVLTADRPPEMRDCSSGQTIDQLKLFGHYPRWQAELAVPEPSMKLLAYLRQTLVHACERTLWPVAGPVHLNLPFRDPLAPTPDQSLAGLNRDAVAGLLKGLGPAESRGPWPSEAEIRRIGIMVEDAKRLLIAAGPGSPSNPAAYVNAVVKLAQERSAPVLADALSPLRQRGWERACVVEHYDFLLERNLVPQEKPDLVLRLGGLPTSKRLRRWLEGLDCPQLVVEEGDQNVDPLHSRCVHVRSGVEALCQRLLAVIPDETLSPVWLKSWIDPSVRIGEEVAISLMECDEMFEGKIPWLLAQHAPAGSVVFISNSTPIRDAEYFWQAGERPLDIYFSRGANGIDGIVSTAMGLACEGKQTFLVTGDLAFLHDQNGLLNARALRGGGLTILLINNNGGGIFRSLPVAGFDPPFTDFFVTPQDVSFSGLCAAYAIEHEEIMDWASFVEAVEEPWEQGLRVLEIRTDSTVDQGIRTRLLRGD